MNANERFQARKVETTETTEEVVETVEYESAQPIVMDERVEAEGNKRARANGTFGDIKAWFYAPQDTMDTIEDGEVIDFVLDEATEMKKRKATGHMAHNFTFGDVLAIVTVPGDVDVDSVHFTF